MIDKMKKLPIIVLALFFVLTRLFLLYASTPTLSDGEETAVGTIAMEFIRGPLLFPVTVKSSFFGIGETYQALCFVVPLYAVFGAHFILLKIAPLTITTLSLIALFAAIRNHHGIRAAMIGALLWTLPPTIIIRHQLLAWARHSDSILFVFVGYLILLSLIRRKCSESSSFKMLPVLFFGVFCGFAFSYYPEFIVFTITAGIILLLFSPLSTILLGLGFAIGNIPFIYILCNSTQLGSNIISTFMISDIHAKLLKLTELLLDNIPTFLSVRGGSTPLWFGLLSGYVYVGLFYLFLSILLIKLLFRVKHSAKYLADVFFPLYVLVFVMFYLLSGFTCGGYDRDADIYNYKYLILLFPAILWIVSISLNSLFSASRLSIKLCAAILTVLLLVFGVASFISVVDLNEVGTLTGEAAYDYYFTGDMLGGHYHNDLAKAYNLVDTRIQDPVEKKQYYSGISSITNGALNRAIWKDPDKFRSMTSNLTQQQLEFLYVFQGKRLAGWLRSPKILELYPYEIDFYWKSMDPKYLPIAQKSFHKENERLNHTGRSRP